MATESDLRDVLRHPEPDRHGQIDLDAVLTRTRRRRRPRLIVAQALASVAVVGVLGTAVVVAGPFTDGARLMTADDAAGGAADSAENSAEDAGVQPLDEDAATWTIDACGTPVTEPVADPGLTLEMSAVAVGDASGPVPLSLTLRNDSPDRIVGTSATMPHVSLARDGVVVWHSAPGESADARSVDLSPGESLSYAAWVEFAICTTEHDVIAASPRDLPRAPAGSYDIRAVLAVTDDDGVTRLSAAPVTSVEITR